MTSTAPRAPRASVFNLKRTSDTHQNIIAGILLCVSPVNTFRSFIQSGPRYLRTINKEQYTAAARELEAANCGVVNVSVGGVMFIKKAPALVEHILAEKFSGFCTYSEYRERYELPIPKSIKKFNVVRKKLHEYGLER